MTSLMISVWVWWYLAVIIPDYNYQGRAQLQHEQTQPKHEHDD